MNISPEALPTNTPDPLLFVATCRGRADSPDPHNHVPLAAGHYRCFIVKKVAQVPHANHTPTQHWTKSCFTAVAEDSPYFRLDHAVKQLPSGDCIIVVHGFNCDEAGGLNTAYNTRDLLTAWGLPSAPATTTGATGSPHLIAFTWPCVHSPFRYMTDKQAVTRFAAFSLANLITDLRQDNSERRIHIVAHSMGCFLTLKALNLLAILHPTGKTVVPLVDDVIWLAPDINADALECTAPEMALQHQQHLPERGLARRILTPVRRAFTRPQPVAASAKKALHDPSQDGYGYAMLNVVRHLTLYCSWNDEALWVSPLANRLTEESGSVAQGLRLGMSGPLHPGLMMESDPDAGSHQRRVTLVECTPVVYEHGDYFFQPIVQQDITQRLQSAQNPSSPVANPSPATPRPSWLWDTALQYPDGANGAKVAPGLEMYQLTSPAGKTVAAPVAQNAPIRKWSGMSWLWQTPLAPIGDLFVKGLRWQYGLAQHPHVALAQPQAGKHHLPRAASGKAG